ncbi:hypothetical protein WG66_011272, partial [Moniliophthora roreri]
MSERWHRRFHAGADGQSLGNFRPLNPSPVPYPNHQPYYHVPSYSYPINSAGPANSFLSDQVEKSHPNSIGSTDDFSHTSLSNGQLVAAQGSRYGGNMSDGPYATSYNLMRQSEGKNYEHIEAATGSSFHNLQLGHSHHTQIFESSAYSMEVSSAAYFHNAAGSSHTPAGTTWPSSDSGYRYDDTYPLSMTNNSAESVLDPNGGSRVIKPVVATEGVVDASHRRRRSAKPGRLYKCTSFPPCQATFTTSHNLKNHIDSHLGNKQHQCSFCPARTVTQSDIKRHEKTCKNRPSSGITGPSQV